MGGVRLTNDSIDGTLIEDAAFRGPAARGAGSARLDDGWAERSLTY
jgi:hypothetical protein